MESGWCSRGEVFTLVQAVPHWQLTTQFGPVPY